MRFSGQSEIINGENVTTRLIGAEAMLVTVKAADIANSIEILSEGVMLELSMKVSDQPILSVVDANGGVVRSAHSWLRSLRQQVHLGLSPNTPEQYGRAICYLCRWLETSPPYPGLTLEENITLLSRENVKDWLRDMGEAGAKSPNTRQLREVALKQFLDWLSTKEGGQIRNSVNSPWGRDGTLPYITATPNARAPKFMPPELVIEVLSGMYNECERCMFHTQYDMGLRIRELVNLRLGDIPDEKHYDTAFQFIPICVNGVKGRAGQVKERITLISRAVLKRIKRYHSSREYKLAPDWDINDPNKPAFLTVNQRRWSIRNASKQLKNSVRRMQLLDAIKTHWLRHGTAYSVLRSDMGKDYQDKMLLLQQMLGHSRLSTTEIYTLISPVLLQKLTVAGKQMNRLGEAELIREKTYLGPVQHTEKRGHRE